MFLSEKIAMDRALQLGLVNRVMPSGDLLAEGMRMANELAAMPPVTLRLMQRNIAAASHASLDEMIEREATAMVRCTKKQDRKSVVSGKSVSVRVYLGGRRTIKKKTTCINYTK